jgi:hypothetical protein
MIYATRDTGHGLTLIECISQKELDAYIDNPATKGLVHYRPVTAEYARKWVKDGGHHETGLYVDDGKVRYAPADPTGN